MTGTLKTEPHIVIRDLTMAYGSFVIQRDLDFTIDRGDIFIIMGGSGCGKAPCSNALSASRSRPRARSSSTARASGKPKPPSAIG